MSINFSGCDNNNGKSFNNKSVSTIVVELDKNKLKDKVIPHRINTKKRLEKIVEMGFTGWELDLTFYNKDSSYIEVKHDGDEIADFTLFEYLNFIEMDKVHKLWFDVKNIRADNIDDFIERMSYLDKKFGLKNKVILETQSWLGKIKTLSDEGWHCSYYLPTDNLKKLMEHPNENEENKLILKILKLVNYQKLSAVSFDVRFYPFVKEKLEPVLSESIVYHTWDLSLSLNDKDFINRYLKKKYSRDERIKTVLIPIKL
jgi:hypothetical protein